MNFSPITWAIAKDTASRAAWTFAQAFIAAFILPPVAQWGTISTWKVTAFAALAAGIAAVKSVLINARPSPAVKAARLANPNPPPA